MNQQSKPTGMTMKYEELENMIDTSGVEVSDISILMRVIEIWYNDLILQEKKALLEEVRDDITHGYITVEQIVETIDDYLSHVKKELEEEL